MSDEDLKRLEWLHRTMRSVGHFREGVLFSDGSQVYAHDPNTGLGLQFTNACNQWVVTQNRDRLVAYLLFTSMQDLSSEYQKAVEAKRVYPPLKDEPELISSWDRIKDGFGL